LLENLNGVNSPSLGAVWITSLFMIF
jgi:hypothetical protein